ncbi:MAG: hypothetical protein GY732_20485, partial [Gammaproteobacteria bacterium]|nr:hypothetical protein [Gammaproteobacteria bacterium]
TSTVEITINGTNDAATVSNAVVALAETDAAMTTSGTLTSTDVDNAGNALTASSTVGAIGTFAIDAAGDWTFTANNAYDSLNVGDSVNEIFNVTSIDGTASTVEITINGTNDAPEIHNDSVSVSEEGLTAGIADTNGENPGDDTTDATLVTGSMVFSDIEGDTLTVALSEPGLAMTSGGNAITWTGEGTDTLTGSTVDADIISIHVDANGDYTVELMGPVDHPNNGQEDVLSFNLNVAVSDGENISNATLSVNVEDDSPTATNIQQTFEFGEQNTNLMFTIDTSGSMGRDAETGAGNVTTIDRMELALTSITDVINSYDDIGNVRVQIVTFDSGDDSTHQAQWMTVTEALAFIGDGTAGSRDATLEPGGGTDYDQAVMETRLGFDSPGKIVGTAETPAANVSYFLSDGQPQTAGGIEGSQGITGVEIAEWTDWLVANNIDSYAVGFGLGLDVGDQALLDPLAYNGLNDIDRDGVIVVNANELAAQLLSTTVITPMPGSVFGGGIGVRGFGADGGYLESVSIDNVTYTFNPTANAGLGEITISTGGSIVGSVMDIDTALNGQINLDLNTGEYGYIPDAFLTPGGNIQEAVTFVAIDSDGDQSTGTVTLNISRPTAPPPQVSDDTADVFEEAMPGGSDSGSTAEVAMGNIFANDTLPFGLELTNISIAGGTTDTGVIGQIAVTTAEGNLLVVNSDSSSADFGDYTYTLVNPLDHTVPVVVVAENFDAGVTGWGGSVTAAAGEMRIPRDQSAVKTFDFGLAQANQTVTVDFDLTTTGGWENGVNWTD